MQAIRERLNLGPNSSSQRTWRDEMSQDFKDACPSLSYENRLYAFAGCVVIGIVLSFVGVVFLYLVRITPFAIFYSMGSIAGLLATMFLVGPMRQLSLMFTKNRWVATLLYIVLIALTLFIGTTDFLKNPGKMLLVIILVILQFLAAIWYSLSYIPYARKVLSKLTGGYCDCIA